MSPSHSRIIVRALLACVLLANCQRAPRGPVIVTYSPGGVSEALPLPACDSTTPPAAVHRRLASSTFATRATAGRVLVHVVRADSGQPIPSARLRLLDLRRVIAPNAEGRFLLDSLVPTALPLRIEAIGYQLLRDTLTPRAGYEDTVVVGLAIACH